MPVQIKRSTTPTNVPTDLAVGQLAVNIPDGKLWVGTSSTPTLLNGLPAGVLLQNPVSTAEATIQGLDYDGPSLIIKNSTGQFWNPVWEIQNRSGTAQIYVSCYNDGNYNFNINADGAGDRYIMFVGNHGNNRISFGEDGLSSIMCGMSYNNPNRMTINAYSAIELHGNRQLLAAPGYVAASGPDTYGVLIVSDYMDQVGLIVRGHATQNSDLQQWQNGGATLATVDCTGLYTGNLNADNMSTGTVPLARLGINTPTNAEFLRGDNVWAVPGGSTGGDVPTYCTTFNSTNLSSNVLTVNHELSCSSVIATLYDNNQEWVLPTGVNIVTEDQCTVDLTALVVTGTWTITIVGISGCPAPPPVGTGPYSVSFSSGVFLDIPMPSSGFDLGTAVSYSLWLQTTQEVGPLGAYVFGTNNYNNSLGCSIVLGDGGNGLGVVLSGVGGPDSVSAAQELNDGAWHHVVWSVNGNTTQTLWVDGVNKGSAAHSWSWAGYGFRLGRSQNDYLSTPLWPFSGSVCDLRLYNRALDGTDVATLYNGGTRPAVAPSLPSGLMGWWLFDDAGTTAVDSMGNQNGTWSAAPSYTTG